MGIEFEKEVTLHFPESQFAFILQAEFEEETNSIEGLIMAGLEYGDNDKDGKMDNKRIENEFPELQNLLKSKYK